MKVNKKPHYGHKGAAIKPNRNFEERRGAKDIWARLFIFVNYIAWTGLMIFLILFHKAQPEFETFFDRFYHLNLRTYWDKTFIRYLAYTSGFGLAASVAGLFLALFRARRKTDHSKSIIILGCLYLILIILSWILL